MKPTMTIFVCVLAAGLAAAQSPMSVIENTRATMNGVRDNSAAASNAALGIQGKGSSPSAAPAPAKSSAAQSVSVKPASTKTSTSAPSKTAAGATQPGTTGASKAPAAKKATAGSKSVHAKAAAVAPVTPKNNPPAAETVRSNGTPGSGAADSAASDDTPSKWNANGKRDPFLSPVVNHAGNASCSTGKKCLEIGTITLRGIVHGEQGFIAVVSNGLNKAYFLRENDPVFNGYVMKITGDSITFQETLQDRLGKSFTREVVKKITTPAV
jgi:hypothetical protein